MANAPGDFVEQNARGRALLHGARTSAHPNTTIDRHRAGLYISSHARDAADCELLLAALGLDPEPSE